MAYVINKINKGTNAPDTTKQGSAGISGGTASPVNRNTAFASPMDMIKANQEPINGRPVNEAISNALNRGIAKDVGNIRSADEKNFASSADVYKSKPAEFKGYNDPTSETGIAALKAGASTPNAVVKQPVFGGATTQFGSSLKTGMTDINPNLLGIQGQNYTAGMSSLDSILAGRGGALANALNNENYGKGEILSSRLQGLANLQPGITPKYTAEDIAKGDYSKLYGSELQNASDVISGTTRTNAMNQAKTLADRIREAGSKQAVGRLSAKDKAMTWNEALKPDQVSQYNKLAGIYGTEAPVTGSVADYIEPEPAVSAIDAFNPNRINTSSMTPVKPREVVNPPANYPKTSASVSDTGKLIISDTPQTPQPSTTTQKPKYIAPAKPSLSGKLNTTWGKS